MWQPLSLFVGAVLIVGSVLSSAASGHGQSLDISRTTVVSKSPVRGYIFQSTTKKPVVLLVHGYPTQAVLTADSTQSDECSFAAEKWQPGTHTDFEFLPNWLSEDGYPDIRLAHYQSGPSGTPDIEANAACLRTQIIDAAGESATGDVVIVAFSHGGLVTRAYLESDLYRRDVEIVARPLVSKVFLIGTPNHGMPFNGFINVLFDCSNPDSVQRAACQFTSTELMQEFNNKYSQRAPGVDYYLIGGVHYSGLLGALMGTYICAAMGPNDGTVPTSSATELSGVRQTAVFHASHLSVVGAPSYFGPDVPNTETAAYTHCIYPVLVEGNLDGCQGTVPVVCDSSSIGVGLALTGVFVTVLSFSALRVAKQRKNKRNLRKLEREPLFR